MRGSVGSASPPLYALCLHGWRTNGALMSMQTARLRSVFGQGNIDMLCANAPHQSPGPADESLGTLVPGPYFEWWNAVDQPNHGPTYAGIDDSLRSIFDLCEREGPFDLLVGFSQGGMMATILSLILSNPEAARRASLPTFPNAAPRPWGSVVLVGSMLPRDPALASLLEQRPSFPSFHIYGEADAMFEQSKRLAQWWGETGHATQQAQHNQGHRFPSDRQVYQKLAQFVHSHSQNGGSNVGAGWALIDQGTRPKATWPVGDKDDGAPVTRPSSQNGDGLPAASEGGGICHQVGVKECNGHEDHSAADAGASAVASVQPNSSSVNI